MKVNHILLIDDDEATNVLNKIIIEEAQVADKITVKETGKLAIEYLLELESNYQTFPEIIFLDVNMPVMNGWEFLEAYRDYNFHKNRTAIVVMLTTSLNPDDKKRAEAIEYVNDFKHKPISEEILMDIIKNRIENFNGQVDERKVIT